MSAEKQRECPLCGSMSEHSICAFCVSNLEFLQTSPPAPDATDEEVLEWARTNKVQVFRCGKK